MDMTALPLNENNFVDLDESEDRQFVVGRPSDTMLTMIQEGLDHITTYLTDLVAHSGQPPQQLIDRFVKQYTGLNSENDWNKYSKYYTQKTQAEVDRLRQNTGVQSDTIDPKCISTIAQ